MKLFSKKKVVYELTPEQKAFLATCHELTLDELRLVNGGGNYGKNGMPSNIPVSASNSEKNESPANASAASGSSSYTGGSKGYNGMPTDVKERVKNSSGTSGSSSSSTGVSNVSSTSSTSSGSTNTSGTSSSGTGSSSSSYSSTDSGAKESVSGTGESAETSHKTENKTISSSGSSYSSGSSSKASSSTSNSSSGSTSSSGGTSSSGESKKPFPQPYAGAYEHGSYAEERMNGSKEESQVTSSESTDLNQKTGDSLFEKIKSLVHDHKKHGIYIRVGKTDYQWDNRKNIFTGADYSNAFVNQVTDSLVYLKNSGHATETIEKLSQDDNYVVIKEYGYNHHTGAGISGHDSLVCFNPGLMLRLNENSNPRVDSYLSPALCLYHELSHAESHIIDGTMADMAKTQLDSVMFPNAAEMNAVMKTNFVSYDLGEAIRYSYKSSSEVPLGFGVNSVTGFKNMQY